MEIHQGSFKNLLRVDLYRQIRSRNRGYLWIKENYGDDFDFRENIFAEGLVEYIQDYLVVVF